MQIRIVGDYISHFGELWQRSLEDLILESIEGVLADAHKKVDLIPEDIEAIFLSNMASGLFNSQLHLGAMASGFFEHRPPAMHVEGACASGGLALVAAQLALQSRRYKTVLVIGVEKMTDVSTQEATQFLSTASSYIDEFGSTFPALYALVASAYMHKFSVTRDQLSSVSVKNHLHALTNPNAQFKKKVSLEQVNASSIVASPLRLLDCSAVSDGSSAVILSTNSKKEYSQFPHISGFGHGQDTISLAARSSLTSFDSTKRAAAQAYTQAKISPDQVTFAEVHDCFSIAELVAGEDLGFFKVGTAALATFQGKTTYGGKVVINPSGGLKACGHPVGATGVKQVAFLSHLLLQHRNKTVTHALAHNVGGSGATATVQIISL